MAERQRPQWSFILADCFGSNLTPLTTHGPVTAGYQRNGYSEAQTTLSHEDEAASLLLTSLRDTGTPMLKAFRRSVGASAGDLVFQGSLAPFQEDADEQSVLNLVFRSPFARLMGEGADRGRFTADYVSFVQEDAGTIAQTLLDSANTVNATGLIAGTTETTALRDRSYQYANVGEAILELSNVLDGFDFEEEFYEGGSTLARLNIYARQGSEQSSARFEYGPDTLRNVRAVSRTTQPPINSARVFGAYGLVGTYEDAASIVKYGMCEVQKTVASVTTQAALDELAREMLRPNPIQTVSFVPEYGLESCPLPFDDFWLGSTVPLYARRGALEIDAQVRVNGIQIIVSEDGYEVGELDPSARGEDDPLHAAEAGFEWQPRVSVEVV